MSFGSKKKLKWLFSPRGPYFPAKDDVFKRGNSGILEIPISAYVSPYIGTTMRVSPRAFKFVEKRLVSESKKTGRPIVFLFHPNECLNSGEIERVKRSKSNIQYALADVLRQDLKIRNMGMQAIEHVDAMLARMKKHGFEFLTVNQFREKHGDEYSEKVK